MKTKIYWLLIAVLASSTIGLGQNNTGTIKGKVLEKATLQPLPFVNVYVVQAETGTTTDIKGEFSIENIPPGNYSLSCSFVGYETKVLQDVQVVTGKTAYYEINLNKSSLGLDELEVTAYRYEMNPMTPVSAYSLSREEIYRNPGAQGDIFRAIGVLPGVQSVGGEFSAIAVRGQGVRDNVYIVDDIPLQEVTHLAGSHTGFNDPNGGRFSIFAPRVVNEAQFQAGGFSAEYGRKNSGLLSLGIKEGNTEDFTIDGQIDLLGWIINYDGPSYLHKNTSIFASAKVQNFGPLFKLIDLEHEGEIGYSDFLIKTTTQLNPKNKLNVIGMYNTEHYKRYVKHTLMVEDLDNNTLGNTFEKKGIAGIKLTTLTSDKSYLTNVAYYRLLDENADIGRAYPKFNTDGKIPNIADVDFDEKIWNAKKTESQIGYRSIFHFNFEKGSQILAGADFSYNQMDVGRTYERVDTSYTFAATDYRPNGEQYLLILPEFANADIKDESVDFSAYLNYSLRQVKRLTVNMGLRYDYTGFTEQSKVSPRVNASYQFTEKQSLSFATGIYYQDPSNYKIAEAGKGNLKSEQSIHYILGYKHYFTPDLKFTLEGYYKDMDDLIVRPYNGNSLLTNDGEGYAYGMDASLVKRLSKNLHGQISYSHMQSRRDDGTAEGEYDFIFSQPHIFTLLASYKLKKVWIFSGKFRYSTGRPEDAYIVHQNIFNDPNSVIYSKEITGHGGDRLDDFISLDVRVDYRIQLKRLAIIGFVDIVNVMDRKNPSFTEFRERTGEIEPRGLGIFPTFGLKFEI
ncbi:TonB-dependent receptor [Bacteroidales bacterium AH-315-I05]|nr:TonB-dependent receptor [Bacteroidales bacterium AH-315-I05]